MTRSSNAVVKVMCASEKMACSGTGFSLMEAQVPGEPSRFCTNYHVVRDAKSVSVRLPCAHGVDLACTVLGVNPRADLAVVELTPQSNERALHLLRERYGEGDFPCLRLANSKKPPGKRKREPAPKPAAKAKKQSKTTVSVPAVAALGTAYFLVFQRG